MMILKLYQVREDSVKTSHVRFFQVDQFCELHLLPLFFRHSSTGSVVGTSFFWGGFEIHHDKKRMFFGEDDLGKVPYIGRTGGAISITSESRQGILLMVTGRESVYLSIYSIGKQSKV